MNNSKEISLGLIWGAIAALLIAMFIFAKGNAANLRDDGGDIEISISPDSVRFEIDKDGSIKSITVGKDRFEKSDSVIRVENELIIEKGRIYIDGVEITEEELERLAVDKEETQSGVGWEGPFHDRGRFVKKRRIATVYTDTADDMVSFSDIEIPESLRVEGDVVSIGGDIRVYGEVNGDVVAIFGDVYLEDCVVTGDVVTPFGEVIRDEYSEILGETVTKKFRGHQNAEFGMGMRYNRVEGLGIFPSLKYSDDEKKHPGVELMGGYAFTLKRWEYDFGISHSFFHNWSPYIDVGMYQLAETSDRWILTEPENSFAAAILKEDFYDFYWKRGFYGEVGVKYNEELTVGICYNAAKIESLEKTAEKALFGGKKKFRENWSTVLDEPEAIAGIEGKLRETEFKAIYDIRDHEENPRAGIFASLSYRRAFDSDSADFEYETAETEVKYYLPVSSNQTVMFRLRGGYSDDDLPLFRRYFIGGIGSLRGYEYKEFEGNRYALFNADYIWEFFESSFGAGIFFDAGKAAFSGSAFEDEDLKTNIGISFLVGDEFRINLAQRLDDMDKSPVLSMRGQILF